MDQEISHSEHEIRALLDSSPAIMWVTRPDGHCTYLNKPWYEFTGCEIEQSLGEGWIQSFHPEDGKAAGEEFMRCNNERCLFEVSFRLRNHDGSYRWVLDKGNPRFSSTGEFLGFVGIVVDIHEKKLLEKALEEARLRFLRVASATGLGVWYCDLPFSDLIWSDEVKNHFWLRPESQVTIDTFYERIHPDDRETTRAAIEKSITEHSTYLIIYRTTHPDHPEQIKWIKAIGWTDYDENNNPIRFDGITRDVSKEIELNQSLKDALAVRDEFLSVASHELKTPLTTLLLHSQMLRRSLDHGDITPEKLANIADKTGNQVKRLVRLIDDMMDISRIRTGKLTLKKEQVDLSKLVADAVTMLIPDFERLNVKLPKTASFPNPEFYSIP